MNEPVFPVVNVIKVVDREIVTERCHGVGEVHSMLADIFSSLCIVPLEFGIHFLCYGSSVVSSMGSKFYLWSIREALLCSNAGYSGSSFISCFILLIVELERRRSRVTEHLQMGIIDG